MSPIEPVNRRVRPASAMWSQVVSEAFATTNDNVSLYEGSSTNEQVLVNEPNDVNEPNEPDVDLFVLQDPESWPIFAQMLTDAMQMYAEEHEEE